MNFVKFSKTTFLHRTPLVAASVPWLKAFKIAKYIIESFIESHASQRQKTNKQTKNYKLKRVALRKKSFQYFNNSSFSFAAGSGNKFLA